MVQNLKQKSIHGAELKTEQYAWYRDDTELYMWYGAETRNTSSKMTEDEFFCVLSEKEQYPIETID